MPDVECAADSGVEKQYFDSTWWKQRFDSALTLLWLYFLTVFCCEKNEQGETARILKW